MSIEIMYPSRCQPRSQNPLFSRAFRRKQLALMLALTVAGAGLLTLQVIPMTAHADSAAAQIKAAPAAAAAMKLRTPDGKVVREIQIYAVSR